MNTTQLSVTNGDIIDPPSVANLMNTARFNQMMMIAQTMASASLIPDHLLGKKKGQVIEYFTADEIRANCFLIVNQAFRWGMDPFAVMPETYVVGGKLGYQGKLIAGVVNALANLDGRLNYEFSGKPGSDDFTITVSGKFKGADAPVSVSVSVGQAKTENQMWRKDPEQKLVYTGATKWARRYCPEIVLGILTDDDADQIQMREATGHVVEPTTTKVITGGNTETPAPAKAPRGAKAPPAAATTQETAQEPAAPAATKVPPRPDMVTAIRTAYRAAGLKTLPDAEERARKKGYLSEGMGFSGLKDEEMAVIVANLDTIYVAFPDETPTEGEQSA